MCHFKLKRGFLQFLHISDDFSKFFSAFVSLYIEQSSKMAKNRIRFRLVKQNWLHCNFFFKCVQRFYILFCYVFQINCIKINSPWRQMCQLQISSYYWYEIPMLAMFKLWLMPTLFLLWFYQSKSQTFSSYARILLQKFKKRSYQGLVKTNFK